MIKSKSFTFILSSVMVHDHLWGHPAPCGSAREIDGHKDHNQQETQGSLPRFGSLINVKPYSCFGVLSVYEHKCKEGFPHQVRERQLHVRVV